MATLSDRAKACADVLDDLYANRPAADLVRLLAHQRAELLEALRAVRQWHDGVWMTNMPIDLQELVKSTITKAEAAA